MADSSLVTWYTIPPRPPLTFAAAPSAPGKAGMVAAKTTFGAAARAAVSPEAARVAEIARWSVLRRFIGSSGGQTGCGDGGRRGCRNALDNLRRPAGERGRKTRRPLAKSRHTGVGVT